MSGMEKMMQTLLKSMGFDPVELANNVGGFMAMIQQKLTEFDARTTAMENQMLAMTQALQALTQTLKGKQDDETRDTERSDEYANIPNQHPNGTGGGNGLYQSAHDSGTNV